MADSFGTDVSAVQWVVTVFLLVQSGLLLTFGRLGDLYGHKRVYLAGLVVLIVGSALCGAMPTTATLVAARVLQGIGASMAIASSPAILTQVFPPEQRGKALGIQGTLVYLGLATGAPLGGWLTDLFGWRSVFYANVPIGVLALVLGLRALKGAEPSETRESFDLAGAAIYVFGLVALLLALNRGHAWGWTSPLVLGSLALGVLLLAAFAVVERRVPSPMLDLGLFARRSFTAPVVSALLNYGSSIATTFLLPFALIQGRGLTPGQAGLVLTCQPLVMALTASFSGALSDRVGARVPATLGMVVLALGLFALSQLGIGAPAWLIAAVLAIVGLGVGLFTSPNNSALMGAVPAQRRGVASGVLSTARTLGMLLGIGLAGAVYATTLSLGGSEDPDAVVRAANVGLLVASGLALVGAVTSAVRPGATES
jgi:EmrB/QacA subfamily drug resistance transporter